MSDLSKMHYRLSCFAYMNKQRTSELQSLSYDLRRLPKPLSTLRDCAGLVS